jgi:dolichol-phosphate mannosyltransferase
VNFLVIMPTYNESKSLENTVADLFEHVPGAKLLIVDDNSPDGTGRIADELAKADDRISVLHRLGKNGLGMAYIDGFRWARERNFEFVVEMDADGSHRGVDLPKLLAAAPDNDLVIGSRYVRGGGSVGWPLSRRLISKVGNRYTSIMLGARIHDITAGFRIYRLEKLIGLLDGVAAQGYAFQVELAWLMRKSGARIIEVPITFVERSYGESKMSSAIVREALWLTTKWGLGRLFRRRP